MNFIILRESKQASQDRLISIAKEIQKIHPVGAFILYCKSNYNQNMNYGYTPENVDGILFANVLEFNKKTLKERNAPIPPLRSLCCQKLGKELLEQYGNDWTQLTQVYLALADDLQREVAFSMYFQILLKRESQSSVNTFRRFYRAEETRVAFEYACHFINRVSDDYDNTIVRDICDIGIKIGKYAIDKLYEIVKTKVTKTTTLFEYAKLFQSYDFVENAFLLGIEALKSIREFNQYSRGTISLIPDWISTLALEDEKRVKLVFDTLEENPSVELIHQFVLKLSEKKQNINSCIKLLINGYQRNDFYLYDSNEKRNKKYKTKCNCSDCKKITDALENYETETRLQLDGADANHIEEQISIFSREFVFHVQKYTGVPVVIIRKKQFSNSHSTEFVQMKKLLSEQIPELILSLYKKRDSKISKEHVMELKESFVDSSSLYTLAKFCKKEDWIYKALDLALEAAKSSGSFDRNTIRNEFSVLGGQEYKIKLAEAIMKKEPKASNYHKLKELNPNVKLDDYIDIKSIKDQTIPILLMESKFKEIAEGYKSITNEKHKYILTLLKECIDQELKVDVVKEHFMNILEDFYLNSAYIGYHIEMFYNFPRITGGDEIIQLILTTKLENYPRVLGAPLVKIRTNCFMNSISSTKPSSYRKFAEWLMVSSVAFDKNSKEYKDYQLSILNDPIVRPKKKLVGMVQRAFSM